MSMWEPFTERAHRAIVLAQEAAAKLRHTYIGSEHILLGIMDDKDSRAAKTIRSFDVDNKLRRELEEIFRRDATSQNAEHVFSPSAKRTIELAFEEARQMGDKYIAPEHLILGMLRTADDAAFEALEKADIDKEKLRTEILNNAKDGFS
jgi:ATP-dependent Clp protease ATP-binding subunit ClpC